MSQALLMDTKTQKGISGLSCRIPVLVVTRVSCDTPQITLKLHIMVERWVMRTITVLKE